MMGEKTLSESYPSLILLGGGNLQSRNRLPTARVALNFCHGKKSCTLYMNDLCHYSRHSKIQGEFIGIQQ